VQKFALPSSGKRVSARVNLALVPDLSIMLYLLRFMMHTMDLEMPFKGVRKEGVGVKLSP